MQDMHGDAGDAPPIRLLTTRDVQHVMRVDRSTVYRMAESGRLPAVKVGRQWRFPEDRFQEWLAGGRAEGVVAHADDGGRLSPEAVTALADLIGELLGTMILVTDMAGRPLAEPGHPCELYSALHGYPGVLERCLAGWRDMAADADLEPRWIPTPLGFLCAHTLVRVGDHLEAMVLAAGVAPPDWPPDDAAVSQLAEALGVPPGQVAAHIRGLHYLTPEEQARVLRLLPRVGAVFSRLAGHHGFPGLRASESASGSTTQAQRSNQ